MTDRAESAYRLRSDVRVRAVESEALVLRQHDAEVLGLNVTGARLLDLLAGGASVGAAAAALAGEFEVTPEDAARDAAAFVAEMVEAEVLERVAAPRPAEEP